MKLLILLALLLPQKTFVSNLIFLDGGQEIGRCQAAEDDTNAGGRSHDKCRLTRQFPRGFRTFPERGEKK